VVYPRIAILYYRSSIKLQPSASDLITAFAGSNPVNTGTTSISTFTAALGTLEGDARTHATPFSTNVLTTINNFYQVRANYQFQVTVSITDGTLQGDGTTGIGNILMSNVQTELNNSGTWAATVQQTTPGGLGTVHKGDVRFNLDFTGASINNPNTSATFGDGVVQTQVAFY
jgi:predicted dehydrogenase